MNLLHMMDTAPDAIIVLDRWDRVAYWNDGATNTFGFSKDEMMGQSLSAIVPEPLRQRHAQAFQRFIETGRSAYAPGHTMAVPALHKRGDRLSIQFRLSVTRDESDAIQYVMAIIRDVTATWNRTQEQGKKIRELEERLKQFEATP